MFSREAAVKHNLLASENPKNVGNEDSMINVELMTTTVPSSGPQP